MRAITKTDKASKHHQSNHILPRISDAKGDKVISNASTEAYKFGVIVANNARFMQLRGLRFHLVFNFVQKMSYRSF